MNILEAYDLYYNWLARSEDDKQWQAQSSTDFILKIVTSVWHTKIDPQLIPAHKNNFHKTGERFEGWGELYVMFCSKESFSVG